MPITYNCPQFYQFRSSGTHLPHYSIAIGNTPETSHSDKNEPICEANCPAYDECQHTVAVIISDRCDIDHYDKDRTRDKLKKKQVNTTLVEDFRSRF